MMYLEISKTNTGILSFYGFIILVSLLINFKLFDYNYFYLRISFLGYIGIKYFQTYYIKKFLHIRLVSQNSKPLCSRNKH